MKITRINTYNDPRFSRDVLNQHGCFLVDDQEPYEVEIISSCEAIMRGRDPEKYSEIIEEFRFFTPHITIFYDSTRNIIAEYPSENLITIPIADIQPSQFYVDEDKVDAIRTFIHDWEDIIIQVIPYGDRFISADGHTRLYYAVQMGWKQVRGVRSDTDAYIHDFVKEAIAREIHSPKDLQLLSHEDYEVKWNQFCDDFFALR